MEQYYPLLCQNPLFAPAEPGDLQKMLTCLRAQVRHYKRDTFLHHEGDPVEELGIVLEGTIQIVTDDYDGNRSITAALGPGQLFLEAFACAGVPTLPVSIYAATDCTVLLLNSKQVLHPCEGGCTFHNQLVQNLLKIVSLKNVALNQKLGYLAHKTTQEKLMAFLTDQAKQHHSREFTIPYDRQALADYLGVERSAMSAELGKLQRAGILTTNRNHFRLL